MYWYKYLTMTKITFYISILLYFFLIACDKDAEIQPKDYPYVVTEIPILSNDSILFSAKLKNMGSEKILKYGFYWSNYHFPITLINNEFYTDPIDNGTFTYKIADKLVDGNGYFVRAYVETQNYKVCGNEIFFLK